MPPVKLINVLPPGYTFVIGMRDLESPIEEQADYIKVSFATPTPKSTVTMLNAINSALIKVGETIINECVDRQPSLEAHFKNVYEKETHEEDRFLVPRAISSGEKAMQDAIDRVVMSKSKSIAAARSYQITQVRFAKGELPEWIFETPTLVVCMVVRDGAVCDFVGMVSVHSAAVNIRRVNQALKMQGVDEFDTMIAKTRSYNIVSPNTLPPVSASRKAQMTEFFELAKSTVLSESFKSLTDYRMALGLGIKPSDVKRYIREINILCDFAPMFLDPSMAPVLDTALVLGIDTDNFRTSYLHAIRDFQTGSTAQGLRNTSVPDISNSLAPVASIKGVPCGREYSAGYSPYGSEISFMYVVIFPWLLPRDMVRTYDSIARGREDLIRVRSGRSNNTQVSVGDVPVSDFLQSGTAAIVERVARAEREALGVGEVEFEIPYEFVAAYNAYVLSVPSLSVSFSAQDRKLVVVSRIGDVAFVMRSFIYETFCDFNEEFKEAEVAEDGTVPESPIVIVDAPARTPYYDVVDAGMGSTSVFIAPDMATGAALQRDMQGLEVHVPTNGRVVFTHVLPRWHKRIENVVFVCAHLWDSVSLCRTAVALRRAFEGARVWLFGDTSAQSEAFSARVNGVCGSIYHSLVKEAIANNQKKIGVLDPVPRVTFDVSGHFYNHHALPLSDIPKSFAAFGKGCNYAITQGLNGHIPGLVRSGFITTHAYLWPEIVSIDVSKFFDTGSGSSILSMLRESGASYAVVIDAPRPYENYMSNARRAVDNLLPEDPDDLIKRGTVLACRHSGLHYFVTHILNSSGDEMAPFPLSSPPPGVCMWLEPNTHRMTMHEKAINSAKSMVVTEIVSRFQDEFKIASVVPITEAPVVDFILFFSRIYEQGPPLTEMSLHHADASLPEQDSREFQGFDESDALHVKDRKIQLGVIPEAVVRTLCYSARLGLFLGYPDGKCSGFSSGANYVPAFDMEHPSLLSNASSVALLVDPVSQDLRAQDVEEPGQFVAESGDFVRCSDMCSHILRAALKMRYDPPVEKSKKKKNRAGSPSEMEHVDDADLEDSEGEEEFDDEEDEDDRGFVIADDEDESGSGDFGESSSGHNSEDAQASPAPPPQPRSLSLSLSPSPSPAPPAPPSQQEPILSTRDLFGSGSDTSSSDSEEDASSVEDETAASGDGSEQDE